LYAPLGSENAIDVPVELSVYPPNVTHHKVPDGSVDSVNVTECTDGVGAKATWMARGAPQSRNDPVWDVV
jgi:hypothetical protein